MRFGRSAALAFGDGITETTAVAEGADLGIGRRLRSLNPQVLGDLVDHLAREHRPEIQAALLLSQAAVGIFGEHPLERGARNQPAAAEAKRGNVAALDGLVSLIAADAEPRRHILRGEHIGRSALGGDLPLLAF